MGHPALLRDDRWGAGAEARLLEDWVFPWPEGHCFLRVVLSREGRCVRYGGLRRWAIGSSAARQPRVLVGRAGLGVFVLWIGLAARLFWGVVFWHSRSCALPICTCPADFRLHFRSGLQPSGSEVDCLPRLRPGLRWVAPLAPMDSADLTAWQLPRWPMVFLEFPQPCNAVPFRIGSRFARRPTQAQRARMNGAPGLLRDGKWVPGLKPGFLMDWVFPWPEGHCFLLIALSREGRCVRYGVFGGGRQRMALRASRGFWLGARVWAFSSCGSD
jgi:hypothetical protein